MVYTTAEYLLFISLQCGGGGGGGLLQKTMNSDNVCKLRKCWKKMFYKAFPSFFEGLFDKNVVTEPHGFKC